MMITSTTEYTSMRYAENARSNSGKIVRPTAATMEPVSEINTSSEDKEVQA